MHRSVAPLLAGLVTLTIASLSHAASIVLIDQDFEGFSVNTEIVQGSPIGDASTSGGRWSTTYNVGDIKPKIVTDAITGAGNQALVVNRTTASARPTATGDTTTSSIDEGIFTYAFSFYMTSGGGFFFSVQNSGNGVLDVNPGAILLEPGNAVKHWNDTRNGWATIAGTSVTVDSWHDVRAEIDLGTEVTDTVQLAVYFDDVQILDTTLSNSNRAFLLGTSKVAFIPAKNGSLYYIDDIQLASLPEPGILGVLGLGGMTLMHRRRR